MFTSNSAVIGSNIKTKMRERGMRRQDLANVLGVSGQTIYRITKGKKQLKLGELMTVADTLHTSMDYLLSDGPISVQSEYNDMTESIVKEFSLTGKKWF